MDYDKTVNDRVEIKRLYGYLFVRPKVDGQDIGWFFLDTGADSLCIDPEYARKLNLTSVGADIVSGAVGVLHMDICRASTFQLGPITIKAPILYEFDLAAISKALDLPISGVCGYDFISRAMLELDPQSDVMRVLRPGSASMAADLPSRPKWTRIAFNSNIPTLQCRFAANHEGYFDLDTGSGSTIDFCAPAVEKFHLLSNANNTKASTGGAGGTAESRQGNIDWFELGRARIKSPQVGFQLTKVGTFASPYYIGNIGMGLMGRYHMLIDYTSERIAFIPATRTTVSR